MKLDAFQVSSVWIIYKPQIPLQDKWEHLFLNMKTDGMWAEDIIILDNFRELWRYILNHLTHSLCLNYVLKPILYANFRYIECCLLKRLQVFKTDYRGLSYLRSEIFHFVSLIHPCKNVSHVYSSGMLR